MILQGTVTEFYWGWNILVAVTGRFFFPRQIYIPKTTHHIISLTKNLILDILLLVVLIKFFVVDTCRLVILVICLISLVDSLILNILLLVILIQFFLVDTCVSIVIVSCLGLYIFNYFDDLAPFTFKVLQDSCSNCIVKLLCVPMEPLPDYLT